MIAARLSCGLCRSVGSSRRCGSEAAAFVPVGPANWDGSARSDAPRAQGCGGSSQDQTEPQGQSTNTRLPTWVAICGNGAHRLITTGVTMNEPPISESISRNALSKLSNQRCRGTRALKQGAVLAAIRNRASEIGLDPAGVAKKLGLSVRYLHRLLQPTGRTFAEHLLDRRLSIAAALLRDPQAVHLKIGEIATRAGFSDPSHFSRCFRHAFGDTPYGARAREKRNGRSANSPSS